MNTYRKAAELLFNAKNSKQTAHFAFCCNALKHFKKDASKFKSWFYHPESELFGMSGSLFPSMGNLWFGSDDHPENQLARQLALLFMEQIEKDEKLK